MLLYSFFYIYLLLDTLLHFLYLYFSTCIVVHFDICIFLCFHIFIIVYFYIFLHFYFYIFYIFHFNFSIICVSDYVLLYMWLNVCVIICWCMYVSVLLIVLHTVAGVSLEAGDVFSMGSTWSHGLDYTE